MKKNKNRIGDFESTKVYLGFWNDDLYAASTDKRLVKMYFEDIRKCKPSKYVIISKDLDMNLLTTTFSGYVLEPIDNYYLPRREIVIIDSDRPNIEVALEKFLADFASISFMARNSKKLDGLKSKAKSDLKYYKEVLSNPDVVRKLNKGYVHPLFTCNLKTCRDYIQRYNEQLQMDKEYKNKVCGSD